MFLSPTNAFVGDKNISVVKMHGTTIKITPNNIFISYTNYKSNTNLYILFVFNLNILL